MGIELELVVDAKASLGEGPCWDAEHQLLYWVDILEKKVHIYDPAQKADRTIDVPEYVGAVVPKKSGGLLLFMQNGLYVMDLEQQEPRLITELEADMPDNRSNDGKCDPAGRFWAGTMEMDAAEGEGSLYCMDTDQSVKKVVSDTTISNGLAWSPDRHTMYFIDTPTRKVDAYDYDIGTGYISNRRTAIKMPEEESNPDGMTIDYEGMLWIAHFGGSKIGRWNPETTEKIEEVRVPATQVTSCVFGGQNLDELYITTARTGLGAAEISRQPSAGGVFRMKTNVRGSASHPFG